MRIDRLLCFLRFTKTRSAAQVLIDQGHIRRNGARVARSSQEVLPGDILTLPLGQRVRLVEVLELPARRGPAREAQGLYRELDPAGQTDLAAVTTDTSRGKPQP